MTLLPNAAKVSRSKFFDDVLLPRLADFCGAAANNGAAQPEVARDSSCLSPSYVKADNVPLLEWLEKLPSIAMSASDQARVLQCYVAMKPSYERGVMVRTSSTHAACAAAADNLWTREDLAVPSLTHPINVSSRPRDDVIDATVAYAHWQRKNITALLAAPTRVRDLYLGNTPVGIVADACRSDTRSAPSPPFSGSLRWAALREVPYFSSTLALLFSHHCPLCADLRRRAAAGLVLCSRFDVPTGLPGRHRRCCACHRLPCGSWRVAACCATRIARHLGG